MKFAAALLALLAAPLAAQAPPGTDIFLMPLTMTAGSLTTGAPRNMTARTGYDNQPFFSPDGRGTYYTSQRVGQTGIYRYDLAAGPTARVTRPTATADPPTATQDGPHGPATGDATP